MLGTWRLHTKDENSMFMRQAIDPVTARPVVQQACNSCRVKKLRCSGEKTGCSRCKTSSRSCVYAQPAPRVSGRPKKNKSEGQGSKHGSGSHWEDTRRAPPSPTPTANAERRSAVKLAPESLTESSEATGSAVTGTLMDFNNMELADSMGDFGTLRSLGPFDMSDGFGEHAAAGLRSPSSVEQWLVSSPPALDVVTDLDMDTCLWPNDVVDPAAFSVMTTPLMMTPPLSTPTLSTPTLSTSAARDGTGSPPSGTRPAAPSDGHSSPHAWGGTVHASESKLGLSSPSGRGTPGLAKPAPLATASSSSSASREPCQCLQTIVILIDELESVQDTAAAQLDAGLASHREALRYGEAMMLCSHCTSRPENMTILTFLTDRLACLCERIVSGYFELLPKASPESESALTAAGGAAAVNSSRRLSPTAGSSGVFFGDYEVDSASEWELLVRNLIVLQLRALGGLMGRVKEVSGLMQCDTPWRKAVGTEKRIAVLLDRLNSMAGWDA